MVDDPYKVLGISRDASKEEIKKKSIRFRKNISTRFTIRIFSIWFVLQTYAIFLK